MIDLAIFDHDMTLVDSSWAIMEGFNRVADAVGRPRVTHEQVMRLIATPLPEFCEGLLGSYRPEWLALYLDEVAKVEAELIRPYPDTVRTMGRLRDMGVALAVASNREDPRPAMERTGLAGLFDAILGANGPDGRFAYKPDPAMLIELMRRFDARPETTLYVGDSEIDMRTAKAAGVRGVGIARGDFSAEQLLELGAWRAVSTLDELVDIVEAEGPPVSAGRSA
ncbi:MAG: HAD family hydrolase [Synergistaceae bacterium]|nr:HAD family hydrolase [Synergistaceae bacterium]